MKHLAEYRDPVLCQHLLRQVQQASGRSWTIMELCGGQTHGLLEQGIDLELQGKVNLIHGPGCPVCVTPSEAIDWAIQQSSRPDVILATFGDMLRVPGSCESLRSARLPPGNVRMVYSPLDAVRLAREESGREVIFFAVGFETTAPTTALAVLQAQRLGLTNFSLLVCHVRVLPGLELILSGSANRVDGVLAAGHVCTVSGFSDYRELANRFRVPMVVTGFEPADLLVGILDCVEQLERGEWRVTNRYSRHASQEGNLAARRLIDQVYEPSDAEWRGIGSVKSGGLRLRSEWRSFCAETRFGAVPVASMKSVESGQGCRSGDVLTGRIKPTECALFGRECCPEKPLGAPMVSAEGACCAYYRHRQRVEASS